MNIFKFRNRIDTEEFKKPLKKDGKRLSEGVIKTPIDRIAMKLDKLREAVDSAEDVNSPVRDDLILLYRQFKTDGQVDSQTTTNRDIILQSPFEIIKDKKPNDELKELFEVPWFDKFMGFEFDTEFDGYTLIEFQQIIDGEFTDLKLFPRRHYNPIRKNIIVNPTDQFGLPYEEMATDFFLMELSDKENIGKLELIGREVIYKNYGRVDWSEFNERYGKPILHLGVETDDLTEINKRATMAANFGRNLWLVTDKEDEVTLVEPKSAGANGMNFEKNIKYSDDAIAKIISGQIGTSDQKSFVGSAEVGERILNKRSRARLSRLTNVVNFKLMPFLIHYGYPLEGATIKFPELDIDLNSQKEADDPEKKNNKPVSLVARNELKILNSALDEWLLRFFEGTDLGLVDPQIWGLNFDSLKRGMKKAGIKFTPTYEFSDLADDLENNAASFAAFKNHDEQQALTNLLVDEKGEPRTFGQFKKVAKPITQEYNIDWLRTEFDQSVAQSQMAVKWQGFQENIDLFPNLEYRTTIDGRERATHRALNGTVRPVNSPFWNSYYPPNGWGCRCNAIQTDKPVTKTEITVEPDNGFDTNSGKDGKLFPDKNGYTENVSKKDSSAVQKQADILLKESNKPG